MSESDKGRRMGRPPTHGPRRNVTMALPVDLLAALDAAADARGVTRTAYVVEAVEEKLAREGERRP